MPFTASSGACSIIYSCMMSQGPAHDLCDYSDGTTTSTFDTNTGTFSFTSSDVQLFGTQTVSFTITGAAGGSAESFAFDLNLIDPCSTAVISIDPQIIDS